MLTRFFYFNLFSTTLLPSVYSAVRTSSSSSSSSNACSSSIHSASVDATYDIPMKDITRPLSSTLDEAKVRSLMETIQNMETDRVPPIDVLWYEAPTSKNNYFFAMGGCHRWEAHKRLNSVTIRAKLVRTTLTNLKIYYGSSLPDLK